MDSRDNVPDSIRPDEWGMYNPELAGFAAVLRRLSAGRRDSAETPTPHRPPHDIEPPRLNE